MGATLQLSVTEVAGSASVADNTSRVLIDLRITTNLGTWSKDGTTFGYITLDGTQIADLDGAWVEKDATTQLYSAEHTVAHSADGSKSVTVKAGFDMNTNTRWVYAERALTLSTIPRASTLTAPLFTLGAEGILAISRASESFTHTITYTFGGASGTVCEKDSRTAIPWTPDLELARQIPDSSSGSGTLTITTYQGDDAVGGGDCPFTAYVPGSIGPTVESVSVSPVNSSAVLDGWGVAVRGRSRLSYTVAASGAYGSSVTDCSFRCGGQTASGLSGTTGLLTAAGSLTPRAAVTDSRQRSAEGTGGDITVYDYAVPAITASYARRCDEDGNAADSGGCIAVLCAASCSSIGGRNSAAARVRCRAAGGTWSGYTALENGVETVLPGFASTSSYEVELSAVDALGEEKTVLYAIPTEAVAFKLADGGQAAGFGKHPEQPGLDMNWDIHMNGRRVSGLGEPAGDGDAVPLSFAQAAFAPSGYFTETIQPSDDTALGAMLSSVLETMGDNTVRFLLVHAQTGAVLRGRAALCCLYRRTELYGTASFTAYGNTTSQGNLLCEKSLIDGTWLPIEWVNPDMVAGVVYRTTERWNGRPVYTKLVDCGASAATMEVDSGISYSGYTAIRLDVTAGGIPLFHRSDTDTYGGTAYLGKSGGKFLIRMTFGGDALGNQVYAQLWYA